MRNWQRTNAVFTERHGRGLAGMPDITVAIDFFYGLVIAAHHGADEGSQLEQLEKLLDGKDAVSSSEVEALDEFEKLLKGT